MDDSRLVRDLLDANITLTTQLIELVRLTIGAPSVLAIERAPMTGDGVSGPDLPFKMTGEDDWEDIPDAPLGEGAQVIHIRRRPDPLATFEDPRALDPDLPLHMSEEEEDMRFAVAHKQELPAALADLLRDLKAPSDAIVIDPLA